MKVQKQAAQFVVEDAESLINDDVIKKAKIYFLDTIGTGLAGNSDRIASILMDYSKEVETDNQASILGSSQKTSVPNAAFVNGTLCHALDYDDTTWEFMGHPSAVIVPVVLAVGEKYNMSGEEILRAYIIGTEVSCRLGGLTKPNLYENGWHATSVVGVLGAAAAAGYLLKLTVQELEHALGIASTTAFGLRSNFGSMTKPFHVGAAAQSGIKAAFLAKKGFTSSENALEGDMGYYKNFSNIKIEKDIEIKFGQPFEIVEKGFFIKPFPSCAATHTAIDAVLSLMRDHSLVPNDIKKIRVGSGPVAPFMLIHNNPKRGFEGKFSMQFIIAAAIYEQKIGIDSFTDEKVNDPSIRELMKKIDFFISDSYKYLTIDRAPAYLSIELSDGKIVEKEVLMPLGSPDNPMSNKELRMKYMDCAKIVLSQEKTATSLHLLENLEAVEKIDQLMSYLT